MVLDYPVNAAVAKRVLYKREWPLRPSTTNPQPWVTLSQAWANVRTCGNAETSRAKFGTRPPRLGVPGGHALRLELFGRNNAQMNSK